MFIAASDRSSPVHDIPNPVGRNRRFGAILSDWARRGSAGGPAGGRRDQSALSYASP